MLHSGRIPHHPHIPIQSPLWDFHRDAHAHAKNALAGTVQKIVGYTATIELSLGKCVCLSREQIPSQGRAETKRLQEERVAEAALQRQRLESPLFSNISDFPQSAVPGGSSSAMRTPVPRGSSSAMRTAVPGGSSSASPALQTPVPGGSSSASPALQTPVAGTQANTAFQEEANAEAKSLGGSVVSIKEFTATIKMPQGNICFLVKPQFAAAGPAAAGPAAAGLSQLPAHAAVPASAHAAGAAPVTGTPSNYEERDLAYGYIY